MTIKEMSEKAYPKKIMAGLGSTYDLNSEKREAYITGANDVLNEIERLFVKGEHWCTIGENIQRLYLVMINKKADV